MAYFRKLGNLCAGILMVSGLAGCVAQGMVSEPTRAYYSSPQLEREARMRTVWRGRQYSELLKTMGQPLSEMNVPGRSESVTNVAVFGRVDPAAGCVDAYTVVTDKATGKATIADFNCR